MYSQWFATDLQAQWVALMATANGSSIITDTVYHDRFSHVPELNRFGANINVKKNTAFVRGVKSLVGAPVMSTDIRASASLIIAGLIAKGKTEISRIYHIDRGYEKIEENLDHRLLKFIVRANKHKLTFFNPNELTSLMYSKIHRA